MQKHCVPHVCVGRQEGLFPELFPDPDHARTMVHRTAVGLDPAKQISLKDLHFFTAAAAAEPLKILSALDTGHFLDRKIAEYLAGNILHGRGTAAGIAREILFFQCFAGRVTIGTLLIKAIADLCMQKAMGRDFDGISAIAAAKPDHLPVEALRCLFNCHQMTETLILNILNFSPSVLDLPVSDNSRHTYKNYPLLPFHVNFRPT